MKATIAFPVSTKPVTSEVNAIGDWINQELLKLLPQMRAALNLRNIEQKMADTPGSGVAYLAAWVSPVMPKNAIWGVTVEATGISTSGAAQEGHIKTVGSFISIAGAVSQLGTIATIINNTTAVNIDSFPGANAGPRTVSAYVRDDGVSSMRWVVTVETQEVIL